MRIRKGKPSDAAVLLKLLNADELQSGLEDSTYTLEWVNACLTSPNTDLVLVAEEEGQIIGFLIAEIWRKKHFSYLSDIYVRPELRKGGVASALLNKYKAFCNEQDLRFIQCAVLTSNRGMQGWCKAHGFKRGREFYFYGKRL
ncbi:hypothetical protein COT48_00380 [Candidatus Woesearchaeota archaeon CG08_land_8_20_14_0_20_47_9]|nr:MAG: hypothetical protein COT48_00380 [Candidatus Woesearchaeota archaeon CG08_land_8_20_14_0_20_47_9]HII30027.1 GNAT family N-acetyltransferase [Candidatus Woesearchaeota archaeon]